MTRPKDSRRPPSSRILRRAAIGFSFIIILCWVAEAAHVSHILFNEPERIVWPRLFFRTLVIGGIWLWVHTTTKRLLGRLHYLEEYLHVCSWCRKLGQDGEWVTMEQFLGSMNTQASHGICPTCFRDQLEAHAEEKKARASAPPPAPRGHTFLN
jgi:hypothetical protein